MSRQESPPGPTATSLTRSAEPQCRAGEVRLIVAAVLVAAASLGALTEWLQGVLNDPWAMWANSQAAWLIVAFAAGALIRQAVPAAARGAGTELALLAGYYVARTLQGVASSPAILAFWVVAAVVGGVVFGLAGAWWRSQVAWQQVVGLAIALARNRRQRWLTPLALVLAVPLALAGYHLTGLLFPA